MNRCGDREFFLGLTGFQFGIREQRIVQKRRGLGGEGIQYLLVDIAEAFSAELASR